MNVIINAIKNGFMGVFDYRGRTSRRDFWIWYAFTVVVGSVFDNFLGVRGFGLNVNTLPTVLQSFAPLIGFTGQLVLFIPTIAAMNRRMRDAGLDPKLLWLNALPVALVLPVAFFWMLYPLLFLALLALVAAVIMDIVWLVRPTAR